MHQNIHFRWHTTCLNLEVNFVTLLWISLLMTLSLCLSAAAHTWNWVFALQMGMFVQFIFFMYYSVFRLTKDKIANIRIQKTDGKTFLISITAESRRVSWVKIYIYIFFPLCNGKHWASLRTQHNNSVACLSLKVLLDAVCAIYFGGSKM